jgi:anti-sigma regulatory factor (Ser/Thr protein kinase)
MNPSSGWSVSVEAAAEAAAARRDFVRYLRANADERSDVDAAELVFTELLSNALRFGPVRIALDWLPQTGRLRVHDRAQAFTAPEVRTPELTGERGRGLFLVQRLAQALSYERDGDGNVATALLPVRLRQPAL